MAEFKPVVATPPLDMDGVLRSGRWDEAVFLTYSFDLPFFESYMLPILFANGCRSIAVAACASWLPDRLRAWMEGGEMVHAGRSYTLSAGSVPGVFHPKAILAAGKSGGRVLIGSGNMSQLGMATGGELFTSLEWHGDAEVPTLAAEVWHLLRDVSRDVGLDEPFAQRVESLGQLVPRLTAAVAEPRLVHNLVNPIFAQLLPLLRDGVKELIVWSPFTDERLEALTALLDGAHPERLILGVQPGLTKLNGHRLEQLHANRPHLDLQVRELRTREGRHPSLIHAKGILARFESGEQLALLGSPNLSKPALQLSARNGNLEIAVIHRDTGLMEGLFGEGSYIELGDKVEFSALRWEADPTVTLYSRPAGGTRLVGARLEGEWLSLQISGLMPDGALVVLDGADERPVNTAKSGWGTPMAADLRPRTAELIWPGGKSGPVVVADMASLAAAASPSEPRTHTPLEALDYGADSDIIELLDQLAQLVIGSVHDVDRMLRGTGMPSPQDEAVEAGAEPPVVRLEEIDFALVRQHPKVAAYARTAGRFDVPRIQLWLDEVVRQFELLRERDLVSIVKPLPDDETDEPDNPVDTAEPHRWSVSRRIALRVRNRLRRYVTGFGDPRFWRLVDARWMTTNYVLFLSLLGRLWVRSATPEPIVSGEDLGPLTLDLLLGFWGNDRHEGYFEQLTHDERWEAAVLMVEHHGDALTAAAAIRLLAQHDETGRAAPFTVGAFVRKSEGFGLVSDEVIERARIFLESTDQSPLNYMELLLATESYFTWDRFAANLAWKYGLPSARPQAEVPGLGRFVRGDVLVVAGMPDEDEDLPITEATSKVFGDWVLEVGKRDPGREVVQMVWGRDLLFIFDFADQKVFRRRFPGQAAPDAEVLASGVSPQDVGTLRFNQGLTKIA